MIKVAPSILTADFSNLRTELLSVQSADYIHLDIMDGHFVPNISFGPAVVKALRPYSPLPFEAHLMIEKPKRFIPNFAQSGADIITVHYEAVKNLHETLEIIKSYHVKAGVSLNPATPIEAIESILCECDWVLVMSVVPGFGGQKFMNEVLEKISFLKAYREKHHCQYQIEVDGGINRETARLCETHGADVLVAGSYIYNRADRIQAIEEIRR